MIILILFEFILNQQIISNQHNSSIPMKQYILVEEYKKEIILFIFNYWISFFFSNANKLNENVIKTIEMFIRSVKLKIVVKHKVIGFIFNENLLAFSSYF